VTWTSRRRLSAADEQLVAEVAGLLDAGEPAGGPWQAYCVRRVRDGHPAYAHFGSEGWVRMCFPGMMCVPVTLTEDPEGTHYGWVEPDEDISMVQPSYPQFQMQFPYGWQSEQKLGRGRMVRVQVEERDHAW
jgi:hypothetical protein